MDDQVSDLVGVIEDNLMYIAIVGGTLITLILMIVSMKLRRQRQTVKNIDDDMMA